MRARVLAGLWCGVVAAVSLASAASKPAASPAPSATDVEAANAQLASSVTETLSLAITPEQLHARCQQLLGAWPAEKPRCDRVVADVQQCMASYPAAAEGPARTKCYELRSSQ